MEIILKAKFVYVQPKSLQAQDRFENLMDKFHSCKVKEELNNKVLVDSISGRYSFWIDKEYDTNWEVIK
tara:strand:+ start:260 stop:466 length:207 start_codon:yes stop_codon:yes gene_type:complete